MPAQNPEMKVIFGKRIMVWNRTVWPLLKAEPEGLRFMLIAGRPLREPVVWGGPIVMNTQAELDQAFAEIENGTFIQ